MRAALSRDIQRDMGAVPTAEPFRHTEHRYTPTPPLAAGIITDVSGSMSKVMNPVARSSWIISRAVSMVPDARTMLVAFANNKAAPIIMPGQRPSMVPVMQALSAGNEPMTRAINMVDGCLDLSSPGKARLLIILSDDRMTLYGEPLRCTKRVRRLVASGCRVLWITFIGPRFYEQSYGGEPPYLNTIPQVRAVHVPPDMLGEELPHIIIDEVVRTLQITQ